VGDRLHFRAGDLFDFVADEPADVLVMNRALHHVWHDGDRVFALLRDALRPGGAAVIWEPAWPDSLDALRAPRLRPMAFQNLSEHIQGNHFLRPEEIEAAFARAGCAPRRTASPTAPRPWWWRRAPRSARGQRGERAW
jgi:SAM-dependent methyltransferase